MSHLQRAVTDEWFRSRVASRSRTVGQVMTPLAGVYSLPLSATLDHDTFHAILKRGHTRVPVYDGDDPTNIVALLLVKSLLGIGYERGLTLREVLDLVDGGAPNRTPTVRVHSETKLNVALEVCKRRRVHMLVVTRDALSDSASSSPSRKLSGSGGSLRESSAGIVSASGSWR